MCCIDLVDRDQQAGIPLGPSPCSISFRCSSGAYGWKEKAKIGFFKLQFQIGVYLVGFLNEEPQGFVYTITESAACLPKCFL